MTDVDDLLERAAALLGEVAAAAASVADLTDGSLVAAVQRVEAVGRWVDAARCVIAAEVDERSAWGLGDDALAYRYGCRTGVQLVERLTRVSSAEASRRVGLGRVVRSRVSLVGELLPPLRPAIAAHLIGGTLSTDAARAIDRSLAQAERGVANPADIAAAESSLVESALSNTADYVREEARVWRDYLDPDGVEPREELIHAQRALRVGRERHGLTPFHGEADPQLSALLRAALAESTAPDARPRFLSADDPLADDAASALSDPRTREQRQHDVLLGMLTAGARATGLEPGEMRALTTVMATITASELAACRGMGWLDEVHEPVSATAVAMLACDAGFRLSVLDDDGIPLDEGRAQRLFTPRQRRALALRDGGCAWPGCSAPASWCHAHHIVYWQRGGPTDLDNGVLLCPAHHRMLHHGDFEITVIDRRPHLVPPRSLDPGRSPLRMGRGRSPSRAAGRHSERHEIPAPATARSG